MLYPLSYGGMDSHGVALRPATPLPKPLPSF
jgi:hypothetical protein